MNITTFLRAGVTTGSLLFAAIPSAEASYSVNGFGFGTATASVWCAPNTPPAAPNYTGTTTGLVPTRSFGPGLVGCNPNTSVFVSAGSLWRANTQAVALGGDTVAWDHSIISVTPTSPVATTFLDVVATILDPATVEFSIDWGGSDAGTAQHLQWFDMSIPTSPVLLGEEFRIGAWSETGFIKTIILPSGGIGSGNEEFLVMVSDGVATSTSIPEPSTFLLTALGLIGLSWKSRRKVVAD